MKIRKHQTLMMLTRQVASREKSLILSEGILLVSGTDMMA